MKQSNYKVLRIFLLIALILCLNGSMVVNATEPVLVSSGATLEDMKQATLKYYKDNVTSYDDWELICALFSAGYDFGDEFFDNLSWDSNKLSVKANAASYGSIMLALVAMDQEPRDIWGRNLVVELTKKQLEDGSFGTITDSVFASLSLEVLEGEYNKEALINSIVLLQNEDGGFGYVPSQSDLDLTGMVLSALSNYMDNEVVIDMIDKVKVYLKAQQLETGGYPNLYAQGENSSTNAKVISGLVAIGEDINSSEWLNTGNSTVNALNAFRLNDGSYKWITSEEGTNAFSTKQVLMALADVSNNKSTFSLLDDNNEHCYFDIIIEGTKGNVLDENILYTYKGQRDVTVKEGLEYALISNNIPYKIADSTYGSYIESMNNETFGTYGGYDGWLYLINGVSGMGVDYDTVTNGTDLLFYYGDFAPTTLVPTIEVDNTKPNLLDNISIKLTSTYDEYDAEFNATSVTKPIVAAKVELLDQVVYTDENGECVLLCDTVSENKIIVSKFNDNGLPAVVRTEVTINPILDNSELYKDDSNISNWAKDAVYIAKVKGLMEGYDNSFDAKAGLTRAQLVKVLLEQLGVAIDDEAVSNFEDVTNSDWYYGYIATAKQLGMVNGVSDIQFAPNRIVTREELAVMVANAYKLDLNLTLENDLSEFNDVDDISDWAINALKAMNAHEIITGYDSKLEPKGIVNRETCAVILTRLEKLLDKPTE
jgi:hypothetical protein